MIIIGALIGALLGALFFTIGESGFTEFLNNLFAGRFEDAFFTLMHNADASNSQQGLKGLLTGGPIGALIGWLIQRSWWAVAGHDEPTFSEMRERGAGIFATQTIQPFPEAAEAMELDMDAVAHCVELMSKIDFFSTLDTSELLHLAKEGLLSRVPQGESLFRQGDFSDCLYIVLKGEIAISISANNQPAQRVANIPAGGFFGELGVIDVAPRSATASCLQTSEVFALQRAAFQKFVSTSPNIMASVMLTLCARIRENHGFTQEASPETIQGVSGRPTAPVASTLSLSPQEIFAQSALFKQLSEEALLHLLNTGKREYYSSGTYVYQQGAPCEYLYILLSGEAIESQTVMQRVIQTGYLTAGDMSNIVGLVDGHAHQQSLRCSEDSTFFTLPRADFLAMTVEEEIMLDNTLQYLANRIRLTNQLRFK